MEEFFTKAYTELTEAQKMELASLAGTNTGEVLFLLMENEVINARDEAMAVDPSDEKQQRAKMTIAHAMSKFYTRLRKQITYQFMEHYNRIQEKTAEATLEDRRTIEEIILKQ